MKMKKKIDPVSEYVQIENTPFSVVPNDEGKHSLVMGRIIVSPKVFDSSKEAIDYLETNKWDVVLAIAMGIAYLNDEMKKSKKQ